MSKAILELKKEMIVCYGLQCWMCGIEDKRLTAHHIKPVRNGGKAVWSNIALLNRKQHDLFNYIERVEPLTAKKLNGMFIELNRTYEPPKKEYFKEVDYILTKSLKGKGIL